MQTFKKAIRGTRLFYYLKNVKKVFVCIARNIYCYVISKYFNRFILKSVEQRTIAKANANECINVGFVVWNTSMWKYESLYREL